MDENDKAALESLLIRYVTVWDQDQNDRSLRDFFDRSISERIPTFQKLQAAFSLYNIDSTAPGGFEALVHLFGQDAYAQIIARARNSSPQPPPAPVPLAALPQKDIAALGPQAQDGSVRELTLGWLKEAGDKGVKAGEVRKKIEHLRGETLHEKTVGMTLYRLSREGLSRRKGRTWFYVPPTADGENPGVGAPGEY